MDIIDRIIKQAKNISKTIILPEAHLDDRVKRAAEIIAKKNLCKLIVFSSENYEAKFLSNENVQVVDMNDFDEYDAMVKKLVDLRSHKGMTEKEAEQLLKKETYFACMLCVMGYADGVVCGAKFSSADSLRPALQVIKAKKGTIVVGSMLLTRKKKPSNLLFADVSLNENPDENQLAQIAVSGAEFMDKVCGIEPMVAMLSYSTKGSADGEMVKKMQNATVNAQKLGKNYLIDGEMQVDSALDVITASKKGITSKVGGNANVLIFPDLNAGNISYKLASRLGDYKAIGPIMLNFNKPYNDLSRGCTVEEIVLTVAITKLQANN